jgi:hypothetical protein
MATSSKASKIPFERIQRTFIEGPHSARLRPRKSNQIYTSEMAEIDVAKYAY